MKSVPDPANPGMGADTAPVEGNANGVVRVVVYEDLQCSDCAVFRNMMDEHLLPKYGAEAAFEHRDFPLPKHAWALRAAIAARRFDRLRPGLGLEFRRYALANLQSITVENFADRLGAFARLHGVEDSQAAGAGADSTCAAAVEADYRDGVARGVARTPTVFVNGEPFIESFSLEEISKGIEAAIAAANKP